MSPYGNPPGAPQAPQTLESFLAQRGPLVANELAPLLGAVMDQLSTLHSSGQHHGNLSPDTITVAPTAEGNLGAWLPPSTAPAPDAWPYFQSPEQLAQGGQVGYWSDIYAMAAVVYRALCGQAPFTGASPEEVRQAHLQAPPPSVTAQRPELAPELDQVIQQGLSKAPADRQASMQAFRQAVEAAAMAAPPPAAVYAPAAPAPDTAPAAYALQPAAPDVQGYGPGGMPPQAQSYAPTASPPPTMLQPTQAPKSKSGAPLVAIMAGIAVLGVVASSVVVFLVAGSKSVDKSSSASTSAEEKRPVKRAAPPAPADAKRPVAARRAAQPIALPGVDDKIKVAPPVAVGGGAGPHYRIDIAGQPFRGAYDAPVVIALWSEFQCPYCKRIPPLMEGVLKKYPKDVKFVWLDFPLRFHKQAMPAAIAARAVFMQKGNTGFWRYHDKLFANSRSISDESLKRWADEVGADGAKVERDLKSTAIRGRIERRMAAGKQIGVRGTPSLYINGNYYRGRRTLDGFSTVINAELSKARKVIQAGQATRRGYYAHLMKSGLTTKAVGAAADPRRPTGKRRPRKKLDPKAIYRIPVFKDDPWKGAKRPLVTMVIWSDFECPYCKYMACTLEEVLKKYKRTVQLVYRHNPLAFHKRALPAAEAVEAARAIKGRKGFWKMYAKVFPLNLCPRRNSRVNIRTWLSKIKSRQPSLSRANLDGFARKIRLNKRRYRGFMTRHSHGARIKAQAAAANALGARGTPALFVNGRYVRGFRDFAKLRVIIDEELKKARRLLKRGVKRRKLYNHIIARGSRTLVYLP